HTVCECGYYRGQQAIAKKEAIS
ncbi:MAG TPA: 50S ribosomal protein L32, partial [Muribaculaceae bacterium]|nr:50S ribosomal protein L32 [Muribaculaceae bacterium]